MSIQALFDAAEFALAAYGRLIRGSTQAQLEVLASANVGMSLEEAKQFAARFPLVVATSDQSGTTGLQLAVFKDSEGDVSGNVTLVFRGSTFPEDLAAGADIVGYGAAYAQIVAMANWWAKVSAPEGQEVPEIKLAVYSSHLVPPDAIVLRPDGMQVLVLEVGSKVKATGELVRALANDPDGKIDVTGHSLGGHLAMAFSSLFASHTGQVTVFNAPGFIDSTNNREFFARLGGSIPASGAVLNVMADEALVGEAPFSGAARLWSAPGHLINISIENQRNTDDTEPFSSGNHSIAALVDSLALYSLLAGLAPGLTHFDYKAILNLAAERTSASLERVVDVIGRLFNPSFALLETGNDKRESLYQAIYALRANEHYQLRRGLLEIAPASDNAETLLGQAGSGGTAGLAYRYALHELNPIVVFDPENTGLYSRYQTGGSHAGEIDLYDAASNPQGLTHEYLQDRAAFLERKLYITALNLNQHYEELFPQSAIPPDPRADQYQEEARHYEDRESGFIASTGGNPNSLRHYVFGSGLSDGIRGAAQDDHLFGGGSTDVVQGLGGNDYLEGGEGLDLYLFGTRTFSDDGHDTVLDADGHGVLRYTQGNANPISAILREASVKVDGSTWTSADGKFRYVLTPNGEGTTDLVVTMVEVGSTVTLRDFQNGEFGITLREDRVAPQFAGPAQTIAGDEKDNTLLGTAPAEIFGLGGNDFITGSPFDDSIYGGTGADAVSAGDGHDRIQGDEGRDRLNGGLGDDEIHGGADDDFVADTGGNNLIEGGAGGDVLFAQGGGYDEFYGDVATTLAAAILGGEGEASGARGDWIMAGAYDDRVIGSSGDDALLGGGGADLIVGGAGNDDIAGDLGWVTDTLDWSVTRVSNEQQNYLDFGSAVVLDATEGDADVIYAGAGEDWVIGGDGGDFVDAGSGDDIVEGGKGSDVLVGGAGSDLLAGDDGDAAPADDAADLLDGGAGADYLFGNGGDDVLIGGPGNDYLAGGTGRDIYLFGRADGLDTLVDVAEGSVIVTSGIARTDVKFRLGSLFADFGNGDGIHVAGFDQVDPLNTPLIAELHFDDGQVMTYADILSQGFDIEGTSVADMLSGTGVADRIMAREGDDIVVGLHGNDSLHGGLGSDVLHGGAGNDFLEGGEGADVLIGGAGNDVYVYDTFDTVSDSQGANRIVFGAGIAPENLSISSFVIGTPRLLIELPGTVGHGLDLRGASPSFSAFDYSFADGRILTHSELMQIAYFVQQNLGGTAAGEALTGFAGHDSISGAAGDDEISGGAGNDSLNGGADNDRLLGGVGDDFLFGDSGNDTLVGGAGSDTLIGADGADTYVFGYGDGQDAVNDFALDGSVDSVRLADGISLADVTLTHRASGDLTLTLNSTQDQLTLPGWYQGGPRVEQIVFGDGMILGEAKLAAIRLEPISGTAGDDVLTGTPYEDTLAGLGGDDVLDGGRDVLSADSTGNDLLLGGQGHDTYVLGWRNGRDTVVEVSGEASTVRLQPGMSFDNVVGSRDGADLFLHGRRTDGGLLLKDYYTQPHEWNIETASGSSMSFSEFLALEAPSTGDRVQDLWEAWQIQFKHEWYATGEIQADGVLRTPPWPQVGLTIHQTLDNGAVTAQTRLGTEVTGAVETNTRFGAGTVIASDALSQVWQVPNTTTDTIARLPTMFEVQWDPVDVSRNTGFLGSFTGFDLLIHSLYRTQVRFDLSGTTTSYTLNSTAGATGPDVVNAVVGGSPIPQHVAGVYEFHNNVFNLVEIRGGASSNAITHRSSGMVDGGGGNDVIDAVGAGFSHTGAGGNFLYGGAGNDGITGSGDGDLLSGGAGNDRLAGWGGDDTYYFFTDDAGVDIVNEATWYLWDWYDGLAGKALFNADSGRNSEDTIEFGPGIALSDLTLSWGRYEGRFWTTPSLLRSYETLDVFWGADQGLRVMMPDRTDRDVRNDMTIHSAGRSWGVERFRFADGTTLSLQEMIDRMPRQVLNGGDGDDFLEGGPGNNEFFGGSGFDELYGAFGTDIYHFGLGDGEDFIHDPGGADKVVFGAGITPEMLSLGAGSLLIRIGGGADALRIDYFDVNDPTRPTGIETYEFADGTTLTHAELVARGFDFLGTDAADTLNGTTVDDRLYGLAGNDTLNGSSGGDTMVGGSGNDTYVIDNTADVAEETGGQGVDLVQSSVSYVLPADIENLTLTGFANINGTGNAQNNVITGNNGNNILLGLEGSDTLNGGGADDVLDGGAGADGMFGGAGNDTYVVDHSGDLIIDASGVDGVYSSVSYTLPISIENITLTGTADINASGHSSVSNIIIGNSGSNRLEAGFFRRDSLFGMEGNDTLIGSELPDLLDGGAGADVMEGNGGNDTYVVDDAGDVVNDAWGMDVVQATVDYALPDDIENLTLLGTESLRATGNGFANVITGNAAASVLAGLGGDDIYVVNSPLLQVLEMAEGGIDLVQASVAYALADNVENLTVIGAGSVDGTGNALANVITGNGAANSLLGLDGNDTLNGGGDIDVMVGGRGDDTYVVDHAYEGVIEQPNEGIDLVQSSSTYTLAANVENLTLTGSAAINGTGNALGNIISGNNNANVLSGLAGDDTLIGGFGNDSLHGGEGADLLDGSFGADAMSGGAGDDTYFVDDAADVVSEAPGAGADTVRSTITHSLAVNVEHLLLLGSANLSGVGNALANTLVGNTGNNLLDGRAGNDVLIGAEGSDTYRFDLGSGADTIEELDTNASDIDAIAFGAGITASALLVARSGQDLVISVQGVSDRVTVAHWFASSERRIEHAQFADGTILDAVMLEALAAPVNTPPRLSAPIADQSATEDLAFSFAVPADAFADADRGDVLTFDATLSDGSALPGWLRFSPVTGSFSGTPENSDVGLIDVRVSAADNAGESASDVFTITVHNTNDAPALVTAIPAQAATEDSPFAFAVAPTTFEDMDVGDALSYSATLGDGSPLPAWLHFQASSGSFFGTPENGDVGSTEIELTATDRAGAAVSSVFALTVANTNDVPALATPIGDQTATEDAHFALSLPPGTFVDADEGDALTITASLAEGSALPRWLSFDPLTGFDGTPTNDDVGAIEIRLVATDSAGATAAQAFAIQVLNVNDAPVLAQGLADQIVEPETDVAIPVPSSAFVDIDPGDSLTLTANGLDGTALPGWLAFDSARRTFFGKAEASDTGIYGLVVRATDTSGQWASSRFALTVRAVADSAVSGGAGDDVIPGGSGDERLSGGAGDDALFGDIGDDLLRGGTGDDVLQGGQGDDVLHAGSGQNVLDGGSGDDLIFDASGDSFIVGGAGNDTIRTSAGYDVIVFNTGDGWDTIIGGGDGGNTLSFGGGIRYSDLSLSKVGNDLVVQAGEGQGLVLNDWYAGSRSVLNLQIILDATEQFDPGSSDPLYSRRVQTFNFLGLVSAFDQARAADRLLTSWDITNALLQWHLSASDDTALGGDLAYWYGRNRGLAGIGLHAAQQVIGGPGFGSEAQSLRPFTGLQEGLVKLV